MCSKQRVESPFCQVERRVELYTEGVKWCKNASGRREGPSAWFERTNVKNNLKTRNAKELHLFECAETDIRTQRNAEICHGQWYNRNYWRTWQVASNSVREKKWCYGNWWGMRNAYGTT